MVVAPALLSGTTPHPPTPPTRLSPPARPPAHPSAQIQKHPCLPFLGGYSQHSQSPQWVELVHCSLSSNLSRNMPASRKSSGTGRKHALPEAPPVPSNVGGTASGQHPRVAAAGHSPGFAMGRTPVPPTLHHWTSVSPTAPPGPPSKTTPKFTWVLEANPSGTE